jgi:hypothetical protein
MFPPLPYFKVNICPFPLPHFVSIYFAYLWTFRWPNYIVTIPRYFSFRLPHLNVPTGSPSKGLDKNIQRKSLRLSLPCFASIFFAYLWSFRWPNYIVTLPRYFSFRLPYLNSQTCLERHTRAPTRSIQVYLKLLIFNRKKIITVKCFISWSNHMHNVPCKK